MVLEVSDRAMYTERRPLPSVVVAFQSSKVSLLLAYIWAGFEEKRNVAKSQQVQPTQIAFDRRHVEKNESRVSLH